MLVIPAIDLRGGRCVRLKQGDYARETVYSNDPAASACRWVGQGASFLHVVDLDGAKEGRPVNTATIADIVSRCGVPCQLGGGLREVRAIETAFALGVARVVIGTRAIRDRAWFAEMVRQFPGRLVLGLDAYDGRVAIDGWAEVSQLSAVDVVSWYEQLPLAAIVYTDIGRDGMLAGPNLDAICAVAGRTRHPVIASGGIATIEHVLALAERGIGACILGRSLYEGTIILSELLDRLRTPAAVPPP
jgi:phosphoribosylformimino-5-aminoimidazole carboxamide ribotide isomerase